MSERVALSGRTGYQRTENDTKVILGDRSLALGREVTVCVQQTRPAIQKLARRLVQLLEIRPAGCSKHRVCVFLSMLLPA